MTTKKSVKKMYCRMFQSVMKAGISTIPWRTPKLMKGAGAVRHLPAANFVENEVGKEGVVYGKRSAVCLETQCYPDAVHHENFPSPVYRAGEKYTAHTAFRFLIKK